MRGDNSVDLDESASRLLMMLGKPLRKQTIFSFTHPGGIHILEGYVVREQTV